MVQVQRVRIINKGSVVKLKKEIIIKKGNKITFGLQL